MRWLPHHLSAPPLVTASQYDGHGKNSSQDLITKDKWKRLELAKAERKLRPKAPAPPIGVTRVYSAALQDHFKSTFSESQFYSMPAAAGPSLIRRSLSIDYMVTNIDRIMRRLWPVVVVSMAPIGRDQRESHSLIDPIQLHQRSSIQDNFSHDPRNEFQAALGAHVPIPMLPAGSYYQIPEPQR